MEAKGLEVEGEDFSSFLLSASLIRFRSTAPLRISDLDDPPPPPPLRSLYIFRGSILKSLETYSRLERKTEKARVFLSFIFNF